MSDIHIPERWASFGRWALAYVLGAWFAALPVVAQPANDDCASAATATVGVNIVDNRNGTGSTPAGCADQAGVWYRFDASNAVCSGLVFQVSIDIILPSAGYMPTLAVYDACGGNELDCDMSGAASVSFFATPGSYWIRVGGAGGTTGTARMVINCAPPNSFPGYVWAEPTTPTSPSARYDHAMVYDGGRRGFVRVDRLRGAI